MDTELLVEIVENNRVGILRMLGYISPSLFRIRFSTSVESDKKEQIKLNSYFYCVLFYREINQINK